LPGSDRSLVERYLTYQCARCIREGVPRDVALKAVTLYPAQTLGLDARLGSIEPGKDGTLVVYSGDPLDLNSWVEKVFIEGILAYDRDRDVRLQELFKTDEASAEDRPTDPPQSESSDQEAPE
jgi:imidazolonepropionase-like amidohydrolase